MLTWLCTIIRSFKEREFVKYCPLHVLNRRLYGQCSGLCDKKRRCLILLLKAQMHRNCTNRIGQSAFFVELYFTISVFIYYQESPTLVI